MSSPKKGIKAGAELDNSTRPEGWPKGLRRITKIHFNVDKENGRVLVHPLRVNRGTGWEDSIALGAMTLDDFRAFAARVAEEIALLDIGDGGMTLMEAFGLDKTT